MSVNSIMLTDVDRKVLHAFPQQVDGELTRQELRERTLLDDAVLLVALDELVQQQLIEHTGDPGDPSGDTWKLTLFGLGERTRQTRGKSTLSRRPDGTVILHPPQNRALLWWFGGVSLLYACIWLSLLGLGWHWVGVFLVLCSGVWLALLLAVMVRWTQVVRLTSTTLIVRNWYGGTRKIPRASLSLMMLVKTAARVRGRGATYLLFYGAHERCLKRLVVAEIPSHSLTTFAEQCEVPFTDASWDQGSIKYLRKKYPGSFPWAMQTGALVLIILGVTFCCIILAIVILALANALIAPQ